MAVPRWPEARPGAQSLFSDLPGVGPRKLDDGFEEARDVFPREAAGQKIRQTTERGRWIDWRRSPRDASVDLLVVRGRHRDHRALEHVRVLADFAFDLLRGHVHAAAANSVADTPEEVQLSHVRKVARITR